MNGARPVLAAIIALTVGGCMSEPLRMVSEEPSSLDSNLVCRKEAKTGSHIKRTVCRTQAQILEEREKSQAQLRKHQQRSGVVDN